MTKDLHPGLGSGALREAVAFVVETEGGDLYDQGRVLFSDAREAQDRADDLNSELENESFRVAPLYRALSLSSPIEPVDGKHNHFQKGPCSACGDGDTEMKYHTHAPTPQASPEIRERVIRLVRDLDFCYCGLYSDKQLSDPAVQEHLLAEHELRLTGEKILSLLSRQGAGGK